MAAKSWWVRKICEKPRWRPPSSAWELHLGSSSRPGPLPEVHCCCACAQVVYLAESGTCPETAGLSGCHWAAARPRALPGDHSAPLAPAPGTARPQHRLAQLSPSVGGMPPFTELPAPAAVLPAVIAVLLTGANLNLEGHLLDTRILE